MGLFYLYRRYEYANLKLMMDEILAKADFTTNVMWKRKKEISNDLDNVSIRGNNTILVYAKTGQGAFTFRTAF